MKLEITGYGRLGACGAAQLGERTDGSTVPARAVDCLRRGDLKGLRSLYRRSSKLVRQSFGRNGGQGIGLCYGGAILARQLPADPQWTPAEVVEFPLESL